MVKEHVTIKSFFSSLYKIYFQADIIRESMIAPVRRDAGLGDPLKEYANNDVKAGNFMIKYALEFDAKKPHEFIESFVYNTEMKKEQFCEKVPTE